MRRREFIRLFSVTAITWPLMAHAQQADRARVVGVLNIFGPDDPEGKARTKVFEQALQQLGWAVGRDLKIETPRGWQRPRPPSPLRGRTSRTRAGRDL